MQVKRDKQAYLHQKHLIIWMNMFNSTGVCLHPGCLCYESGLFWLDSVVIVLGGIMHYVCLETERWWKQLRSELWKELWDGHQRETQSNTQATM